MGPQNVHDQRQQASASPLSRSELLLQVTPDREGMDQSRTYGGNRDVVIDICNEQADHECGFMQRMPGETRATLKVNERAQYRCKQQAKTQNARRGLTESRVPTYVLVHKCLGDEREEMVDKAIQAYTLTSLCTDDPLESRVVPFAQRCCVVISVVDPRSQAHGPHLCTFATLCLRITGIV
jgi:hypothetical protein